LRQCKRGIHQQPIGSTSAGFSISAGFMESVV
jgi:hypothetical protein